VAILMKKRLILQETGRSSQSFSSHRSGKSTAAFLILLILLACVCTAEAARIKDIASIGGVRQNQLIGYGLVVGLMGTGDDVKNGFTRSTIANMLSRQGLSMRDSSQLKAKNIAAVMITAQLPPFARTGSRIDVTVSSIGDATSLQGGTLLMTPMRAADNNVYAVAQGALVLGGFSAGGAGASVSKNQTNVAIIANGAIVEREVPFVFGQDKSFKILLYQPDFTTATKLANTVAGLTGAQVEAVDSGTVLVKLSPGSNGNLTEIVSTVENIEVLVETGAVVVMNEKTGTVVMGENVRISTVAVAHGNLSIQIKETTRVSQPLPFAPQPPAGSQPVTDRKEGTIVAPGGQTVVTKDTTVAAQEEKNKLMVVPHGVTIQEVVQALNAIGVTPRDLITIIQTIKAAGALQADLRII
jgi:flagellar P-ring protein precursor FlgI